MMQLHLDTEVYNEFYSSKQRHTTEATDNQFLAILIKHFDKCSTLKEQSVEPDVIKESTISNDSDMKDVPSDNLASNHQPTPDESMPIDNETDNRSPVVSQLSPPPLTSSKSLVIPTLTPSSTTKQQPQQQPALDLRLNMEQQQQAITMSTSLTRSCPECKFTTTSLDQLSGHFEECHQDEGCFPCTCGASFGRMPSFLRHYISCPIAATDLPNYQLPSPPPNNETSSSGSDDHQQQSQPPQAALVTNDMSFLVDQNMAALAPALKASLARGAAEVNGSDPSGRPFKCSHCIKCFKSKALLDQHLHIHYPPRYTCRHCGKKYRWPPVFYHHQRTCKSRPHAANKAQLVQPNPATVGDLVHHQLLTRPPPPPNNHLNKTPNNQLTCLCGGHFDDFNVYVRHINSCQLILRQLSAATGQSALCITTNQKPLTSPLLNPALFMSTPPQPQHPGNKTTGTPERNYCDICQKDFCSRTSLKQHVEGKHSAEAKYTCPGCGKQYRWGASFYYHKKSCVDAENAADASLTVPPEKTF